MSGFRDSIYWNIFPISRDMTGFYKLMIRRKLWGMKPAKRIFRSMYYSEPRFTRGK